ncbi:MAG: Ppx/GppA family phosphatase [Actinobacteria bacterium]|jgi:exopolyphosphatase / guanosine-5'-triphosphate,3'-diphosphate pyrophosphatase|nr:Ppx/GppA family phosphatase [Actinomycetota bacterium]NCU89077.1 Ppx/GppA family phosphatase [Actinomycetota bacterium]NCX41185.1 Ppx/GppA family phosphatase [Burkholderiaceae bacterium]NDA84417.1 Ppx/GppA family phosphatase [Burkholderiaceae bacterium]NDE53155.1 Ppx/GppA family phosphatase [Actinomycetota bacterium]
MRLGVLDVGSNTVHLQVVDAAPGARPNPTVNYKEEVRLSEYLSQDGFLSAEGIRLLREAIRRSLLEARKVETQELLPFATSALREAKNGPDIISRINEDFEIDLQVLSGEDEAKITFLAARRWYGWSSGRLLMVDIGGGSLELAVGVNEVPDVALSLPLGASRLTKSHLEGDPFTKKSIRELRDYVEANIAEILPTLLRHQDTDRAIATSKTLRTLARLTGDWIDGNGKKLRIDSLRKITPRLAEMTQEERSELPGVSSTRARQITAGALVAESVMRSLDIDELEICPWALREGIVLKWLDWLES